MAASFELPVHYNGKEILFPAELRQQGYIHRIAITIDATEVLFEPDEERNYRALIDTGKMDAMRKNQDLLKAIAETLHEVFS